MQRMKGKHYSHEYKEQIARLIIEDHRNTTDVARELEIPVSTLYKWTSDYKRKMDPTGESLRLHSSAEVKKIEDTYQKQVRELQEEVEILKKAMHIFAKNQ